MTTFSQLVDSIVSECKRPDLHSDIQRYLNQTIREVHFSEDRNAILKYAMNFREELVTATLEAAQTWNVPNPANFQQMESVKYFDSLDSDGDPIWANLVVPNRNLNGLRGFYYRVADCFVFSGYGGIGARIGLGWYEFPRSLTYKVEAARPASYSDESGWTYADGIVTDEEKEGARELTSNWLLLRWKDVLAEGLRAKVYKRLSDDTRSRTCYSLYQSLRHGLWTAETEIQYSGA